MKSKPLLTAFLLLAAQQLVFLLLFPPFTEPDSAGYISVALQYLNSAGLGSETRLPGYPLFLSFCYALFGQSNFPVILMQHLLGLVLWFAMVRSLETDRQRLIFSALYFCDLLYNSYQHAVLADFMFSFFICLSAWAASLYAREGRVRWMFLCGSSVALGALTKPALQFFPFFALPFLLLDNRPLRRRLSAAAVFVAIPVLAMGLWSLRNYVQGGRFAMMPMASYHFIGRVVNHMEFPDNSRSKPYFLANMPGGMVPRNKKASVVHAAIADMKAAGIDPETMDPDFRAIFRLSILRRPFSYMKESAVEMFYFFFSAHNLYAKSLFAGRLPESVGSAMSSRDTGSLLLKITASMHPFYWLVFFLSAWAFASNARRLPGGGNFFLLYALSLVAYVALVSSMANEGLARYRMAVQPLMIAAAAAALARIFPAKAPEGRR